MKKIILLILLGFAISAYAGVSYAQVSYDYPKSRNALEAEKAGTLQALLPKRVQNPKVRRCNGVVDCRRKGMELDSVFQFQGSDYSSSDYPGPCRELDPASGKYKFSPKACRGNGTR